MAQGNVEGLEKMAQAQDRRIEEVEQEWFGTWTGRSPRLEAASGPKVSVKVDPKGVWYKNGNGFQCGWLSTGYQDGALVFTTGFHEYRMRIEQDKGSPIVVLSKWQQSGLLWIETTLQRKAPSG